MFFLKVCTSQWLPLHLQGKEGFYSFGLLFQLDSSGQYTGVPLVEVALENLDVVAQEPSLSKFFLPSGVSRFLEGLARSNWQPQNDLLYRICILYNNK